MKKKPIKRKTVLSLYLDDEMKEKLKIKAKTNGRSMSAQAVRIIQVNLGMD